MLLAWSPIINQKILSVNTPIPYRFCKTHPNVRVSSTLRCWRCKRERKIENKLQKTKVQKSKNKVQPPTPKVDIRLSLTIEKKSNFINCKRGYMNVGKYKGINLDKVPIYYLKWLLSNMELNKTEKDLINRILTK